MSKKRENLIEQALRAIEASGETDASIIGSDSSFGARRSISDALYPGQNHQRGNSVRSRRTRIRAKENY